MKREMFVRVAMATLQKMGDPEAAEKAEAIAARMDVVAEALDGLLDLVPPAAAQQPEYGAATLRQQHGPPRASFPSPNPEAMAPVEDPEPEIEPIRYDPTAAENLIVPASTFPARLERAAPPAPVRSLRAPAQARLTVQALNQIIQDRTPTHLTFNVPMENGSVYPMTFERNVISRNAYDSVTLMYYPPNTPANARESTQVQVSLHVDDVPIDLAAVVRKLKEDAISSVRPKGQVLSAPPMAPPGPATSGAPRNVQSTADAIQATQGAFGVSAGAASPPPLRSADYIPSQFHQN